MDIADRIVYLDNGRITNIFTPEELRRLPQDMRERMGLRAVDLQEVLPLTCQPASGKEMLKLCDVALHYKERSILHNINISATKGEVIGVSVTTEPERLHFPAPSAGFTKTARDNSCGKVSRWSIRRG